MTWVSMDDLGEKLVEKMFESWIFVKFFFFEEFLVYNKDVDKTLKRVVQVNNYEIVIKNFHISRDLPMEY